MPNINITVREKIAHTISDTCIVCGNSDYVAIFDFDAEWDAYEVKTARFIWGGTFTDVPFTGNECPVPVIPDAVSVLVGVYAGDLHTTTAAAVEVRRSILGGSETEAEVSHEIKDAFGKMLAGKIDAPQTAQVGEVLTVEEVDTEGKPKKWKTQEMDVADVVKFTEQDLTEEQTNRARKNISVVGGKELNGLGELKIGSDTSFCVVNEYDTTASNLGLSIDEFPMLIIKSAHILYGRQNFYALSATGKLYNGVVGDDIQIWNEMTKRIVVNVSRTEEESGAVVMSADKTYLEIDAAIKSNCDVALNFDGNVFTWSATLKKELYNKYVFQRVDAQHSKILGIEITGTSDGETVIQDVTYSTLVSIYDESSLLVGSVLIWNGSEFVCAPISGLLENEPVNSLLINSSTGGSTKLFMITVDDSGTLSAKEIA